MKDAKTKTTGRIRRSQVITNYGPGALIDLPRASAVMGGLDAWPEEKNLEQINEPRLAEKLRPLGGGTLPKLYAPPIDPHDLWHNDLLITAYRFPQWFVVQEGGAEIRETGGTNPPRKKSRRLVESRDLDDKGRFEGRPVVATRFVRACVKGHVDDVNWRHFVHQESDRSCYMPLWLDELGTSGDLSELVVRCECGRQRGLDETMQLDRKPLGTCSGRRPWLGRDNEPCNQTSRLLIRTASNAYFPQVVSVLSLPDRGSELDKLVAELWLELQYVEDENDLRARRKNPKVGGPLKNHTDSDVLQAILRRRQGKTTDRPIKQAEFDVLIAAEEGYGEEIPLNPLFHARRIPDHVWRKETHSAGIEALIQLHRLREVQALIGFTRFEAYMPDIDGEYTSDVERAPISSHSRWYPAVENHGEGLFVWFKRAAIQAWLDRPAVQQRVDELRHGHEEWVTDHKVGFNFPGGPYIMLHTLSHLLIQSLSMHCGYPASSLRERIYADPGGERCGILIFTGSPDAEGTLGGLVQEARHLEKHLAYALRMGALCSNDPICAQHSPVRSMEQRWLHGAACHGCALIAEPSCEMRNDYLDRALVVPVLGNGAAAFFTTPS